jgi:hypothetical protein
MATSLWMDGVVSAADLSFDQLAGKYMVDWIIIFAHSYM